MAAVCEVCGKGPGFGHNVPWSKKKTNRRWNPNIQRVRAVVDGAPKRLHVCTGCLKAGRVATRCGLWAAQPPSCRRPLTDTVGGGRLAVCEPLQHWVAWWFVGGPR